MYDITSPYTTVNQCRRHLFTQRGRSVDACPPTKDALELHIRRATLQSHIWTHATYLEERDVNITDWGWRIEEGIPSPYGCRRTNRLHSNLKDANANRIADKMSVLAENLDLFALNCVNAEDRAVNES